MTNFSKAALAVTALADTDKNFMAQTYGHMGFTADKWDNARGGNMPTHAQHMAASLFNVRLGSKQALALSLSLRPDGSTAAQRTYAGQGKTQNNIGGCQDILRDQHGTAKLTAGQPYVIKLANGAVFNAVSNKAGHIALTIVNGPTVDATPKVAAKVASKAATPKVAKAAPSKPATPAAPVK